jgi:hypothetical protein
LTTAHGPAAPSGRRIHAIANDVPSTSAITDANTSMRRLRIPGTIQWPGTGIRLRPASSTAVPEFDRAR